MKVNLKIIEEKGHFFAVVFTLCLLLFLLCQRVSHHRLPHGDEGSWMAVAAELSKGNGFSTRWVEFPFLTPYEAPRSDDFRYPGLVVLLAAAFKIFGIHYQLALWVVAAVYFVSCIAFYFLIRSHFGRATALISLLLASLSPLQLYWNTQVYSEGLFLLGLVAFVYSCSKLNTKQPKTFFLAGVCLAGVYLIRPNALICILGFLAYTPNVVHGKKEFFTNMLAVGVGCVLAVLPWLLRNYLSFGNPLHFANSSAIFMGNMNDPVNMTPMEYFQSYGFWFQFERMFYGCLNFYNAWMLYDHGLFIIPMLAVFLGIRKGGFYNKVVAIGFGATLVICCFMSYSLSEAAIRYFSPFALFFMAYGVHQCLQLLNSKTLGLNKVPEQLRTGILAFILILPIINPQRFYLRKYAALHPVDMSEVNNYKEAHLKLIGNNYYLSRYLCQLNFELEGKCLGIQSRGDNRILEAIPKAINSLNPPFLALTREEAQSVLGKQILFKIREQSSDPQEVWKNSFAVIYNLAPKK